MRRLRPAILLGAILLGVAVTHLGGCAALGRVFDPRTGRLAGTLTHRERAELPPAATISVRLVDLSSGAGGHEVVAEEVVPHQGRVPVAFEIRFDPRSIRPDHVYGVEGRITLGGRVVFASTSPAPIAIEDGSDRIDLVLDRVG